MKVILGIIFLVLIIAVVIFLKKPKALFQEEGKFVGTRTDNQGGIEIAVTPQKISKGERAVFTVVFTTHTGDLNFDLIKIATLNLDGEILKPIAWDGGSGGHHLEGALTFDQLKKISDKIVLEMEDIGGFRRSFVWQKI